MSTPSELAFYAFPHHMARTAAGFVGTFPERLMPQSLSHLIRPIPVPTRAGRYYYRIARQSPGEWVPVLVAVPAMIPHHSEVVSYTVVPSSTTCDSRVKPRTTPCEWAVAAPDWDRVEFIELDRHDSVWNTDWRRGYAGPDYPEWCEVGTVDSVTQPSGELTYRRILAPLLRPGQLLFARDGRQFGNAVVVESVMRFGDRRYACQTDFGNTGVVFFCTYENAIPPLISIFVPVR